MKAPTQEDLMPSPEERMRLAGLRNWQIACEKSRRIIYSGPRDSETDMHNMLDSLAVSVEYERLNRAYDVC